MAGREPWGLRGNVQKCRLERTCFIRKCSAEACETREWSDSTAIEFLPNGDMAQSSHQNQDGSDAITTCEYDIAGKLLTVRNQSGGALVGLTVHEYDGARRLVRVLYRPQTGNERITTSYEYDSTGRKKKTQYLTDHGSNSHFAWGIEGTDAAYSAPGAVAASTHYNEREQPTEVLFLDAEGRPLSRVDLRYDQAGHLVEEAQTHSTEVLPPEILASSNEAQRETLRALFGGGGKFVQRTHRYNDDGRRVETRCGMGPLGGDVKKMAYNEHGDPIEEIHECEQREFGMDDQGRLSDMPIKERVIRSETRIRYEYDTHGNWVLKTVESRGGNEQDFTVSSVERRTLTYFPPD